MNRLKVVTQLDSVEKNGMIDDCAWATMACAANFLTGSSFTSKDGIKWGEEVGRIDHANKGDASSLGQMKKAAKLAGLESEYPESWADVLSALYAGKFICLSVEQPVGYPKRITMSKWHRANIKTGDHYGHITGFANHELGAQWADPTMTGKGKEKWAIPVTIEEIRQIAESKGYAPYTRCLILSRIAEKAPEKPVETTSKINWGLVLLALLRKAFNRNA